MPSIVSWAEARDLGECRVLACLTKESSTVLVSSTRLKPEHISLMALHTFLYVNGARLVHGTRQCRKCSEILQHLVKPSVLLRLLLASAAQTHTLRSNH